MLLGFHHVTAIASDPHRNLAFYTGTLSLRLVKRTVNFDDPATHHFYFGDSAGTIGTLLTFFPWPTSPRKARRGAGQIVAVAFGSALFPPHATGDPVERFGQSVRTIPDPDGMSIEVVDGGAPRLHSITICEAEKGVTGTLLRTHLGFQQTGEEGARQRFQIPNACIDVIHDPAAERGLAAPGAVHHVALAVETLEEQDEWRERLTAAGFRVTLRQNRVYFQSIYFRQPQGVLFEIATIAPGLTADESQAELGEHLCLPPWLEAQRASIEQRLVPIRADLQQDPRVDHG